MYFVKKYDIINKDRKGDNMDITINVEDYILNIRAAAVIMHNGKILVHRNINSNHYALPGGRIEIGENSENTIKREILEEMGKQVELIGYISTIENIEGKDFLQYEWLELDKIEQYPLMPKVIKEILKNKVFPVHKINDDRE